MQSKCSRGQPEEVCKVRVMRGRVLDADRCREMGNGGGIENDVFFMGMVWADATHA